MERNYNVYLSGMEKGKADKLFFLNYLCLDDYDVIIDFGCGQGDIIKVCAEMSKATCYGIDRDSFMRHVAGESCKHTRVIFEESLNNLVINNKRILLIFSSVLHEVEDYWKNLKEFIVKHTGLITVAVRDMYFEKEKDALIKNKELSNVVKNSNLRMLGEFIEKYGMHYKSELYHYLLKYSYIDNWDLEMEENYFSFDWSDLLSIAKETIYDRKYILPFKKDRVLADFGIKMDLPTHRQLIINC